MSSRNNKEEIKRMNHAQRMNYGEQLAKFKQSPDFDKIKEAFYRIKRLRVIVTFGDVRSGMRCSNSDCPVATAATRALRKRLPPLPIFGDAYVSVAMGARLAVLGLSHMFSLPPRITEFIREFDTETEHWVNLVDNPDSDIFTTFYTLEHSYLFV